MLTKLKNWIKHWLVAFGIISTAFATGTVGVIDAQTDAQIAQADALINPYTDIGDRLEVSKQSSIEAAGEVRTELVKAEPKVILKKWNGEVALGVRSLDVTGPGNRPLLTDRMEWGKGNKKEMHAYPLPAGEGMEDGGFEIEVVLNEKPASNRFDFAIDGYESLDFFYQPPLTPEEITEGAIRPENVIGSYAVYHKTKANYRLGDTNYATGKAYHIYRPKAVDANGAETWADLSYVKGTLSVTVPRAFLDTAVYPVRVDPTFGYTTSGVSALSLAINTSDDQQRAGNGQILVVAGTTDKITAALKMSPGGGTDAVDHIAFINREDTVTDSHAQVVAVENLDLSLTESATWFDFIASSESLSADEYVLNITGDGTDVAVAGEVSQIMADIVGSRTNYQETFTGTYTSAKENPWTETDAAGTTYFSIYITYTATGFSTPGNCNGTAVTSSAGDNNGFETTSGAAPADVCSSNDGYLVSTDSSNGQAQDTCGTASNSEDDQHTFGTFGFSVPAGATIDGISVLVEGKVDATAGGPNVLCVSLSYDGGTSWVTASSTNALATTDRLDVVSASTDTWGRTWSSSEFSDANFLVKIMPNSPSSEVRDFSLDYLAVRVYSTGGGGGGPDVTPNPPPVMIFE